MRTRSVVAAAKGGWDLAETTVAAGTAVHAAVLGPERAPEVVCVPGLGCSHRYFLPLARTLSPHARVVAVDLPGTGRTPGPDQALDVHGLALALADWLRATGRAGTTLVANSAGCQVVADLAVHAPELVGPAVLVSPTVDRAIRSTLPQALGLLADIPRERPALLPLVVPDYLRCGPVRLAATFRHLLADRPEDKVAHLRAPTAVVRGVHDPLVSARWARDLTDLLPDGRLVEIPHAGHAPHHSAPDEIARLVLPLLPAAAYR